ncbi:MAG: DUF2778 domain-containing protein [Pseudomonadota bacterium]
MSDKYAAERGSPSAKQCSTYNILFDGYYLKLHSGTRMLQAWHARSGKKSAAGKYDYSIANQKVANSGPIPVGDYWIQPIQLHSMLLGSDGWGNYRITIHPYPGTVTHARGGFFIHGGKQFGSAGCIDLAHGIDSLAPILRDMAPPTGTWPFRTDNECHVPVVVKYGSLTVSDP